MIPCSNRIQEILEWVNGDCIADIGCDHAYVVCNAILNHQSKKAMLVMWHKVHWIIQENH